MMSSAFWFVSAVEDRQGARPLPVRWLREQVGADAATYDLFSSLRRSPGRSCDHNHYEHGASLQEHGSQRSCAGPPSDRCDYDSSDRHRDDLPTVSATPQRLCHGLPQDGPGDPATTVVLTVAMTIPATVPRTIATTTATVRAGRWRRWCGSVGVVCPIHPLVTIGSHAATILAATVILTVGL